MHADSRVHDDEPVPERRPPAINGLQAEGRWTPVGFRLQGNYTFTSPRDPDRDQRVGDIASHRINLLGGTRFFNDRLDAELRVNGVLGRKTGAGTTVNANPFPKIADYSIVSAALTYRRLVPGVDLQFSVENLFNQDYWDPVAAQSERVPDRGADSSAGYDRIPPPAGHPLSMRRSVGVASMISGSRGCWASRPAKARRSPG